MLRPAVYVALQRDEVVRSGPVQPEAALRLAPAVLGVLAGRGDVVVVSGGLAVVPFLQFDDLAITTYVAGTAMAITSLEGWLLTPLLMSRAAKMNPVAIFVGLLFWSWVWGVWGTILAVPMLMAIKAVCDRVEDFEPIGELLGE